MLNVLLVLIIRWGCFILVLGGSYMFVLSGYCEVGVFVSLYGVYFWWDWIWRVIVYMNVLFMGWGFC